MDAPISSSSKQGHNSRTEKVVTSEIKLVLPLWSLTLCINFKLSV